MFCLYKEISFICIIYLFIWFVICFVIRHISTSQRNVQHFVWEIRHFVFSSIILCKFLFTYCIMSCVIRYIPFPLSFLQYKNVSRLHTVCNHGSPKGMRCCIGRFGNTCRLSKRMNVYGEDQDQSAAAQTSWRAKPLEAAIPLVECALTPIGDWRPEDS